MILAHSALWTRALGAPTDTAVVTGALRCSLYLGRGGPLPSWSSSMAASGGRHVHANEGDHGGSRHCPCHIAPAWGSPPPNLTHVAESHAHGLVNTPGWPGWRLYPVCWLAELLLASLLLLFPALLFASLLLSRPASGANGVMSRTMTPAAKEPGLSSSAGWYDDWPRMRACCSWHSQVPSARYGTLSRDSRQPAGLMHTKYAVEALKSELHLAQQRSARAKASVVLLAACSCTAPKLWPRKRRLCTTVQPGWTCDQCASPVRWWATTLGGDAAPCSGHAMPAQRPVLSLPFLPSASHRPTTRLRRAPAGRCRLQARPRRPRPSPPTAVLCA